MGNENKTIGQTYKGMGVNIEGSPTGEVLTTSKFAYNSSLQIEYLAEVKIGVPDYENRHFINKFIYNSDTTISRILTAINIIGTDATNVSVEILNAREAKISIVGGSFDSVNEGDWFFLNTASNINKRVSVTYIDPNNLSEMIVENINFIAETSTSIDNNNMYITLEHNLTKDYSKRRWDLRTRYQYQ